MPTPFDTLGFSEAQMTVNRAAAAASLPGVIYSPVVGQGIADSTPRSLPATSAAGLVRAMLDGDHWLGGVGWIGPRPGPSEDGYSETMALIHQGFISQNALLEVVDRHVAGVLGREPHWSFAPRRALEPDTEPTAEEGALISEAEAIATEWWDVRKIQQVLQEVTRTLLYARRATFRLFVPRGKLVTTNVVDDNGRAKTVKLVNAADVPEGLRKVYTDTPLPEKSAVVEDPDSRELVGVVLYHTGQNVTGSGAPVEVAELTYLAEERASGQPLTIIRQASEGAGGPAVRLDFGGRLPMCEISRVPFITSQMVQLQRALNLALSALPRNVITGGWLERVITNAQMPGAFVADPTKPTGKRWVPSRHVTGAGSTAYLKGLKNVDQSTGGESYATPAIHWRPPTDVEPTVDAQESLYRSILREAKQEHVLMTQSVNASGKSREQARADFEMTLQPTAAELNTLGRWLLETVLAMAEAFAGTPGKYTATLRGVFDCVIDTGPITADERTAIDASVTAGTLSRETGMALEGVQDTAAELARIQRDPTAQLAAMTQRAAAFGSLVQQGADIEGAALAVGFTAEQAADLAPDLTDLPEDGPATDPALDPAAPPPKKQTRRERRQAKTKPQPGS